ncbi:iron donor protein CyaY [Alcaligenaceae bacterium]|nr:iron donor protein CyaY [Alcaligenaceae bacterium]
MNETEFLARSQAILDSLESQSDDWVSIYGLDIEASRSVNVLTLVFNDAISVVVNSQTPSQEMRVVAPSGNFHYRFDDRSWNNTRGGPELSEALSQIFSEATGQAIRVMV